VKGMASRLGSSASVSWALQGNVLSGSVFSSVLRHRMLVTSCCALRRAISARASTSSCSVSANFSSRQATRSLCLARWRRWFSRTRFKVCSAETRDFRRDDAVSEAWSDDVEAGDVIDDMVGKVMCAGCIVENGIVFWRL
jgi:hypothetical protein